jgi:hypothetical protein
MKKVLGVLILVILFIGFIPPTYAFWNDIITEHNVSIPIGIWDFIAEWNMYTHYSKNDKVMYHGIVYKAKKNNINKLPTNNKYWKAI